MLRLGLRLAFHGPSFCGWQIQHRGSPDIRSTQPRPSVQAVLETALSLFTSSHVRVIGAGRTDSGVHAGGMVAHADVPAEAVPQSLQDSPAVLTKALSAHVSKLARKWRIDGKIAVLAAGTCDPTAWHARYSATQRVYTYRLGWRPPGSSRGLIEIMGDDWVWDVGPVDLDVDAMVEAAHALSGTDIHVGPFRKGPPQDTRTVRTLDYVSLDEEDRWGGADGRRGAVFTVASRGFVRSQVRNMVGAVVAVGRRDLDLDLPSLLALLGSPDTSRVDLPSKMAPAAGLVLDRIGYANHTHLPWLDNYTQLHCTTSTAV